MTDARCYTCGQSLVLSAPSHCGEPESHEPLKPFKDLLVRFQQEADIKLPQGYGRAAAVDRRDAYQDCVDELRKVIDGLENMRSR